MVKLSITRPAGNIVAVPTGEVLDKAAVLCHVFGPATDQYQQMDRSEAIGGRAVWAYFPQDVSFSLQDTAAQFTRVAVSANHWVLIGNPSTTQTLSLHDEDAAMRYDPVQGYQSVDSLAPGQAHWCCGTERALLRWATCPS